jgi:hypothetical protein
MEDLQKEYSDRREIIQKVIDIWIRSDKKDLFRGELLTLISKFEQKPKMWINSKGQVIGM